MTESSGMVGGRLLYVCSLFNGIPALVRLLVLRTVEMKPINIPKII